MIRVQFSEPDVPGWTEWCADCANAHSDLIAAAERNATLQIHSELYKKYKEVVFLAREGPFRGKCSYCEQLIYPNQYGDIDHFRPKSGLTEEDGSPVMIVADGLKKAHPGYYWLAYEWRNLLPACELCNRPSTKRSGERRIGKTTHFPVVDYRAARPGEERSEQPLLIHPVEDDPADHLRIDSSGVLYSLTEKGRTSIRILGLNERNLPDRRRDKYNSVRLKMQILALEGTHNPNTSQVQRLLTDLQLEKDGAHEYTIAARQAISDASHSLRTVFSQLGA